jgi:hypothetical protein
MSHINAFRLWGKSISVGSGKNIKLEFSMRTATCYEGLEGSSCKSPSILNIGAKYKQIISFRLQQFNQPAGIKPLLNLCQ